MIPPSIGRVVWFHISAAQRAYLASLEPPRTVAVFSEQPLAALVTHVWGDRMINLAVFDHAGNSHAFSSVDLLQDDDSANGRAMWAEWMPFQKGQAAKTEALEKTIAV